MEALLSNIITLGTSSNDAHIFMPPESSFGAIYEARLRLGEEWKQLKQDIKKLQQNIHDLALNYRMRMEANDEGRGLREFVQASFGEVVVSFDGKGYSTVTPKEIKPGIIKTTNPISNYAFNSDMAKVKEIVLKRVQLIREILHDNPFLSDFLAYHIIDDRFRQWEDPVNFVEGIIKYNPSM